MIFHKVRSISYQFRNEKDQSTRERLDEELKNILSNLKKQAIEKFQSESDLKKFLDNVIKFNNYSYNNQMLIWLQNPNAEYVASFKTFSDLGYKITKGEKGMDILVPSLFYMVKIKLENNNYEVKPYSLLTEDEKKIYKDKNNDKITFYNEKIGGFKIGTVFDISQTNMPIELIQHQLNPSLEDNRVDGIEDLFIKAIYRDGFKVKYEEKIGNGAKGYCGHKNKLIVVKKDLGNLMRLKVVVHEYAHALAHTHLENNNKEYKEHRNQYESEAESIAYVVCKYLGLDTKDYSTMYLYSWSKNKDFNEIDDSLNTIVNYSKKIIVNYSSVLKKYLENNYMLEDSLYGDISSEQIHI